MKTIQSFDFGAFNPYMMSNTELKVNTAKKDQQAFFTEDFFNEADPRPWEVRYDNTYPTVFYDPLKNIYRCYYSTFTRDISSSETSLADRQHTDYNPNTMRIVSLCYAESKDGIHWEKPNLGLTLWQGSKENNIIGHNLHGTAVYLDLRESDPKRRYKMITKIDYGTGVHYMAAAFSEDGIHFRDFTELPNFNPRADTYNSVFYDEKIAKYVMVTRTWRDSFRIPCLSYSQDFINWSPIEEILPARGYQAQVYSMPFFRSGDYLIGLASMFHEGDRTDDNFDQVDLELTYSRNYKGWNYVAPDDPFIERGAGDYYNEGDFDNSCIYCALPIQDGNRTYFYYMGGNGQHTNFRETSLGRAYIEHDRYSYYSAKNSKSEAVLYTNGFIFLDQHFYLDAEIGDQGFIQIEFFNQRHEPIEDINITMEKVDHRYLVSFDKELLRQNTNVKLTFKNSKIYKFEGNLDIFRVENSSSLLRE